MKESQFLKNQSFFLGKIRSPTESEIKFTQESLKTLSKSQSPDSFSRQLSPKPSKKYQDFFPYSCFSNKENTKIYLNSHCLSGNLLNRSLLMKEDINNKILPEGDFFELDRVLEENLKNREFHEITTKILAKELFKGKSSCVLLYGAKKSGKTFLLRGNEQIRNGLLQNLIKEIHLKIKKARKNQKESLFLFFSIYQIYNNEVFDLLQKNGGFVRESPDFIEYLKKMPIENKEDLSLGLQQALNTRKLLSLENKNIELKRKAHFVIRAILAEKVDEENMTKIGEINLVELADANFVKNKEINPLEMDFLNTDFNELFDSIVTSYTNLKRGNSKKKSRLLLGLKENLKIESKMLMICCVSPAKEDFQANKQSLKFVSDLRCLIRENMEKEQEFREIQKNFKEKEHSFFEEERSLRKKEMKFKEKAQKFFEKEEKFKEKCKEKEEKLKEKEDKLIEKELKTLKEKSKEPEKSNLYEKKQSFKEIQDKNTQKTLENKQDFLQKKTLTPKFEKNSQKKRPLLTFISEEKAQSFKENSEDLLEKSQKLRDKKTKLFDILDKGEELIFSKEIDDLKREILVKEYKNLYYKTKEIKKILNEFNEKNKLLQEKINEKDDFIEKINEDLKEIKENLKEKNEKIEVFNKEYEDSNEKIWNLENFNKEKEEKIKLLTRDFEENLQNYEELQEKLRFLEEENRKLTENRQFSEDFKLFANKKEAQIRDLISEIKDKNVQISNLQETIEFQGRNLNELKEKISDLQRNLEVNGLDNREIKRIAQEKIARNQNFQEIINELTEKLKEKEFEYQSKNEELVYFSQKNKELKARNRDLETENHLIKSQKTAFEQEIKERIGLESKNSFMLKEISLEKNLFEKNFQEANLFRKELEKSLSLKKDQIKEEKKKNEEYKEKFEDNYRKTLRLEKENDELHRDLEKLLQKAGLQEKNLESLQKLTREQENQLDFFEKKLKNCENEYLELKENSEKKIERFSQENEFLKRNIDELENKQKETEKRAFELEDIKEKHKNQANLLKYEKKKLKEAFEEKETSLIRHYEGELLNKENSLCRISEERERDLDNRRKNEQKLSVLNGIQSMISSHKTMLKK